MRAPCIVVAIACLASSATAQPQREPKSETTATVLTVAGIVVPVALFANLFRPGVEAGDGQFMLGSIAGVALLPAPAMGHWYAGRIGTYGMLMRFGGIVFAGAGLSLIDDARRCARGEVVADGCEGADKTVGGVMAGLGISAIVGSWIYDVVSARREVRERNGRTLHVAPLGVAGATGLTVATTF